MLDRERFAQGLTYAELLPRLRNRRRVEAFYRLLSPLPPLPAARALVLVEDWCPDSVQAIPVLARLPLEARFFFRDENPDLAEAYQKEGKRIVPTVVFLDEGLKELARWHGPPEAARAFLREAKGRLEPAELFRLYHQNFPRFAEAMLAEWRALLPG
ncbi:thioredoxin family protein [Thermus filiformis]|uniref:Thioredoxin n=1 Tax=Thermus filiformis TaxID=276 RepID=A0A0A2WQQ7_THEFI|nr:thioredoxin family protein [Thermus filiformis]KGQ21087.1 hypothetical protein THFILI_01755 [Thermus filiformis]